MCQPVRHDCWRWIGTRHEEQPVLRRRIGAATVFALPAGAAIWVKHAVFQREPVFSKISLAFWSCAWRVTARLIAPESIMTTNYPFSIIGDEFTGKRVLVTGGTKGIGEAIVRRFQLSGASLAAAARSPRPQNQSSVLFVKADIGTASGVQEVVDRIKQEWGGLDIYR